MVPRGNRFATLVRATRADFGGEVTIEAPDLPTGVDERRQGLAELVGVLVGQVDLVGASVERERDRAFAHRGEEAHELVAGDTLALPRAVPHAHRVNSEIARILTVATPGGFEKLFLEHGAPGDAPPRRPPDEVLVSAVRKLGVERLGPP